MWDYRPNYMTNVVLEVAFIITWTGLSQTDFHRHGVIAEAKFLSKSKSSFF